MTSLTLRTAHLTQVEADAVRSADAGRAADGAVELHRLRAGECFAANALIVGAAERGRALPCKGDVEGDSPEIMRRAAIGESGAREVLGQRSRHGARRQRGTEITGGSGAQLHG